MSESTPVMIKRRTQIVYSEKNRVITRPHFPHGEIRVQNIIDRVLSLKEKEVQDLVSKIFSEFSDRHRKFQNTLEKHFHLITKYIPANARISQKRKLLLGAYFTMEYSVEAAALFNPSIVLSPHQKGVKKNSVRFVMSFRATGEGHISSIEFRSGILNEQNSIFFDPISTYVETPEIHRESMYNKHLFQLKLDEMSISNEITFNILQKLDEEFTIDELNKTILQVEKEGLFSFDKKKEIEAVEMMRWLANSNYEVNFDPKHNLSERVIFPVSESESKGIEDARFVRFIDDNDQVYYYATYTAYNGFNILPQLIETRDFLKFKIITLNGNAVQNKGMALFPRKIRGKYVMLSRQDGENNHIMFSDHLHFWQESSIIQEPMMPWEYVQLGNCGSPLETEKGWLLVTHGVGPMRKYSLGVKLLDLEDPSKVIGHIDDPIMTPNAMERDGYVPNVLYSCGAMIHKNELIIPYAMSDSRSGIANIPIKEIFSKMRYD